MYDNIGNKIKALAIGAFFVEAIGSIIGGIRLISTADDPVPLGIVLVLVGPIVAWASSWILYGFGELIEKVCGLYSHIVIKQTSSASQTITSSIKNTPTSIGISGKRLPTREHTATQCPHCGEIVNSNKCSMCGKSNNLFD